MWWGLFYLTGLPKMTPIYYVLKHVQSRMPRFARNDGAPVQQAGGCCGSTQGVGHVCKAAEVATTMLARPRAECGWTYGADIRGEGAPPTGKSGGVVAGPFGMNAGVHLVIP